MFLREPVAEVAEAGRWFRYNQTVRQVHPPAQVEAKAFRPAQRHTLREALPQEGSLMTGNCCANGS